MDEQRSFGWHQVKNGAFIQTYMYPMEEDDDASSTQVNPDQDDARHFNLGRQQPTRYEKV